MKEVRSERISARWVILVLLLYFSFLSTFLYSQSAEDKVLQLPLGPARYRGQFLEISPGQLFSAGKGRPISFAQMIKELNKARFIYLGETHDDLEMHEMQFKIIEALAAQNQELAIGLEQVTVDLQPVLDDWVAGKLDEENFLRQIRWYITWNFNYGYYKKIFDLAREKHLPLFALNAPRQIISKIRMSGYESLTEEERRIVPSLDLTNEEHRLLLKTIFESEEIPPQMRGGSGQAMFEALYRAQVAWDETMGRNAVRAAEETSRKVIVLAGSGHLLYHLGLNFRAERLARQPMATVIGVRVKENSKLKVSRGLADYIYGVQEKSYPFYPAVGLSLKKVEGLSNLVVQTDPEEPLAQAAGFKKGDVILSAEDKHFDDLNEWRMFLARFNWGSEIKIKVLRNGEVINLTLKLEPELLTSSKKKEEN